MFTWIQLALLFPRNLQPVCLVRVIWVKPLDVNVDRDQDRSCLDLCAGQGYPKDGLLLRDEARMGDVQVRLATKHVNRVQALGFLSTISFNRVSPQCLLIADCDPDPVLCRPLPFRVPGKVYLVHFLRHRDREKKGLGMNGSGMDVVDLTAQT